MTVGVGEGEEGGPEGPSGRKSFGQTQLQTVVVGIGHIAKLIEKTVAEIIGSGLRVEQTAQGSENKGVRIHEVRELVRRTPHVVGL